MPSASTASTQTVLPAETAAGTAEAAPVSDEGRSVAPRGKFAGSSTDAGRTAPGRNHQEEGTSVTTALTPQICGRGGCGRPATAIVHVDYPASISTGPRGFRWSKQMCDSCRAVEAGNVIGATVTTTPLAVTA